MKFGVISFPGSCDDVDAQLAAGRVGEAVSLWHADHDLRGVDAVIVPGGFSYGDYLRPGAIARFSPIMTEVIEFANAGGYVMGICNGFQVCCEAGLLPGALLDNLGRRFVCRQVSLAVVNADTAFTARSPPASACRSLSSTRAAATTHHPRRSRGSRPPVRWCCATRRVRTPTAHSTTSPAWSTSAATCSA